MKWSVNENVLVLCPDHLVSIKCPNIWASLAAQMVKDMPAIQENWFDPWIGKISWRRAWQPPPVFLLGEFQGESLEGHSPRARKEWDTTEKMTL